MILIIPAIIYDCTEEIIEELKRRYTMHPESGYNYMIRRREFRHPVATEGMIQTVGGFPPEYESDPKR